ncbi:MAG TPA: GatB/YqeY domain-containing protein [Gammaproteobacteria bacterium]|nr:GatB/YqeY domain-containing protein [Gammaproteobacteria bacterium]
MSIKDTLTADMKAALKAGDKDALGTVRMALAAVKQREIDDRKTLSDAETIAVLDKMVKQRRESIEQYQSAGRSELAEREQREINVISRYLPQPLTDAEIDSAIDTAIAATGATSMKDMGKVMAALKDPLAGRADMAAVSGKVKSRLSH